MRLKALLELLVQGCTHLLRQFHGKCRGLSGIHSAVLAVRTARHNEDSAVGRERPCVTFVGHHSRREVLAEGNAVASKSPPKKEPSRHLGSSQPETAGNEVGDGVVPKGRRWLACDRCARPNLRARRHGAASTLARLPTSPPFGLQSPSEPGKILRISAVCNPKDAPSLDSSLEAKGQNTISIQIHMQLCSERLLFQDGT